MLHLAGPVKESHTCGIAKGVKVVFIIPRKKWSALIRKLRNSTLFYGTTQKKKRYT